MSQKKRYAHVGTGGRAGSFINSIAGEFKDFGEVVGLCDTSPTRMEFYRQRLMSDFGYPQVPVFAAKEFDRMIEETRPDTVIVTSMDCTHHEYIVRGMELGCDIVTEKPMTTDDEKCRAILAAQAKTGRRIRVAFNYRWQAGPTELKKVLSSGVIGDIKSVDMEYLLDTSHGADYFRRWHSYKDKSGGLLVHKATHHFDLVNWWIDAIPETVFCLGDLVFYGKKNAVARSDDAYTKYPRYTGYDTGDDPFALKLDSGKGRMKELYLDAEKDSGYLRDENVFRDGITIEDTMSLVTKYRNGVTLTYSLNCFGPYEGFRVNFNGDKGRVEFFTRGGSHIITGQSDEELAEEQAKDKGETTLRVMPLFQPSYLVEVRKLKGGHGGADPQLHREIFHPEPSGDAFGRSAGHEHGVASIMVGIAANHSMATGKPVNISDLVELRPGAVRLSELT